MESLLIGIAAFFVALRASWLLKEHDDFWQYFITCIVAIALIVASVYTSFS